MSAIPLQVTFDKVRSHLRKQNKKSMNKLPGLNGGMETCMYLALDGSQCAAGCLIPPEEYNKNFEGKGLFTNPQVRNLMERLGHDLHLVYALQSVHDGYDVNMWEVKLKEVATQFKLVYDE